MNLNSKEQKRLVIINKFLSGKIPRDVAMEAIQVKERQFRRILRKYEENSILSLKHGNTGKTPWNKTSKETQDELMDQVKNHYFDYNMSHAREMLLEEGFNVPCYTTFRQLCHQYNMVKHPYSTNKQKVRKTRERSRAVGLMLQIDGSYHKWFGNKESCLIIIVDDATGKILYGKFCSAETVLDCCEVIEYVLKNYGIFGILYADKAGVYGGPKREGFGHILTGLDELNITSIAANSPEAKGRVERAFKTLQDRLIPEMRSNGIRNMEMANYYFQNIYMHEFNRRFAVSPLSDESFFKPLTDTIDLEEVFCKRISRKMLRGHRFSFNSQHLVVETEELDYSLVGRYIEIKIYRNGAVKFFCNGIELTVKNYQNKGNLPFKLYAKKHGQCAA